MRLVYGTLLLLFSTLQSGPDSSFIFDTAPFASCHASTIVELRNGDLLAAWFGGSGEGHPDVAIWNSRLSQGRWSTPTVLAREPDIATYNPVFFYTNDGKLWLYYKFGPHPDRWAAARRSSLDNGETWSATEHLPAGLYGPIRAKPLVLNDGTVVSGTSVEAYGTWACWIERSTDNGQTFRRIGPIAVPGPSVPVLSGKPYGIIQPSVVSLGGARLRFYARSTAQIGKICIADSIDNGLTWTPAHPIDVPNPNSGIDAVSLRDGRIVLVYNNTVTGRSPLNLAVSHDGEHFRMFYTLENEPGAEFSYPAMIQGQNGDLLITYTWKRRKIRYVRFPLAAIPQ
jgi:predicted neuraminidase